jgi:sugar lactone lactonase YvrE
VKACGQCGRQNDEAKIDAERAKAKQLELQPCRNALSRPFAFPALHGFILRSIGGCVLPFALSLAACAQSNYPVQYTFTTLAGPSRSADAMGSALAANVGSADGTGTSARFSNPDGVAVDKAGNVYVADNFNDTIRKVTPAGVVTTVARQPCMGMALDSAGNIYVVNQYSTICKVTPAGVVTMLAGLAGSVGSADGTGSAARFKLPNGVALDTNGNVYVADTYNYTIRKMTPVGTNWVVTTLAGLAGLAGSADGMGTAARFNEPNGVAVDNAGNLYVTDLKNHTIREVTPAGMVTTLAGLAGSYGSADGTGTAARFANPYGVAVDSAGNVYVTDSGNSTIRKVTPAGVVTTLAGLPMGYGYADGTGRAARFRALAGVVVDSAGTIYVTDPGNNNIRRGFVQK